MREIDTVVGKNHPGFKVLADLDYTRRLLQETMRQRPPIYWIVRNSVGDDEIDGYTIPSGKLVVVMSYLIHRDPDVWEQPHVFDPERFCPEMA